jgi:hypothetical protein
MNANYPDNSDIADALDRIADLLEAQGANAFRVGAYRRAARRVADQDQPVADLVVAERGGKLEDLPDIGKRIAGAIREFVRTGRIGLLDRLEGEIAPEDLMQTVPNIGNELASRIHDRLGIENLEELELAAHAGELESVPGIGPRRAEAITNSVGALLKRAGRRRGRRIRHTATGGSTESDKTRSGPVPEVGQILELDAEYRHKAEAGRLKTIAPRRFNPEGRAWLPIMHTDQSGWHFTALYSNTARAHDLDKVKDWVVIYYDRDGTEGQCTVVTESGGPLEGRRVIRGREKECREFYSENN